MESRLTKKEEASEKQKRERGGTIELSCYDFEERTLDIILNRGKRGGKRRNSFTEGV